MATPKQQPNTPTTPLPAVEEVPAYAQGDEPIVINSPEGVELVSQMVHDGKFTNDADGLFELVRRLRELIDEGGPSFKKQNEETITKQEELLAEAEWFVLPRLTPRETKWLFKEHLGGMLEYELDEVVQGLELSLLVQPDWDRRDKLKEEYRKTIAASELKIGQQQIDFAGSMVEPTVRNWIRDWRDFLQDRPVTSLLVLEYINSRPSAQALSDEDRKKVEQILKLLVELSKSSKTPEGSEQKVVIEDPVSGTFKVFEHGELQDTGVKLSEEELKELRYIMGYDESGNPLTPAQIIKTSPGIQRRYEQPVESAQEEAPEKPLPEPRPEPPPPAPPALKPKPTAKPKPPAPTQTKTEMHHPTTDIEGKPIDFQEVAHRVLGTYNLLLESAEAERRFLSIIVSYLKEVRDFMEAKTMLTRPTEEGGVNLHAQEAEGILHAAEEELQGAEQHPREYAKGGAQQDAGVRPTFAMAKERIEQTKEADDYQVGDAEQAKPEDDIEDIFANVNPTPVSGTSLRPMPQGVTPAAPSMADIVPPSLAPQPAGPVVMGPIDELQAMSLGEFRSFGPNPRAAAQHLLEKISLLEQESIARKAEGIDAWKASPLNQLYVKIGNESLARTAPIEQVIQSMQQAGEETLTPQEFDAIADLNRQLRF